MFCKRFDWRKEFKNVWNAGYAGGRRFPKTEIDWLRLQKIIGQLIPRHQLRISNSENALKAWHPLNWCLPGSKQVKLVQISSAGSNRSDLAQVLIKEFRLNYIGCAPFPGRMLRATHGCSRTWRRSWLTCTRSRSRSWSTPRTSSTSFRLSSVRTEIC